MRLVLDLQNVSGFSAIPKKPEFSRWVRTVIAGRREATELTMRIVDEPESAELNQRYRGKLGPTNVLSFPAGDVAHAAPDLLGDLVICAPIVAREALTQHKTAPAHWAHIVVHGVLHLLGYDHEHEKEAVEMEGLEVEILARLGIHNPYLPTMAA